MTSTELQTIYENIIELNDEDQIRERVDELKEEFVYDWEDDFDDIHEAYEEQGRGEAETQVISEVIKAQGNEFHFDDYCTLHDKLKSYWEL